MRHGRRAILALPLLAAARPAVAQPRIRVGTLRFGSVGWELDVMRVHGMDAAAGIVVEAVEFAGALGSQVALQAGRVDVTVQDWLWVSRLRATGADWTLSPTSGALGAVMAPAGGVVRDVAGLRGRRLGVAGSALDKSWLILRAYAQRVLQLDLERQTEASFGAPSLLAEQMALGRLDAMLTYWPFAARAEAAGHVRLLAMEDAVLALGIPAGVPFLGWAFAEAFAAREPAGVRGFVAASTAARRLLSESDAEWERIAPLTGTTSAAELVRLRDWWRRGALPAWNFGATAQLYDVLAAIGGTALVGTAAQLAPGTFWNPA